MGIRTTFNFWKDKLKDVDSEQESEAALLRRLAQEKRTEQKVEEAKVEEAKGPVDLLWTAKREEFGPLLVPPAKALVVRRARAAALRGELSLTVDLGVNERRLRTSSTNKELNFAEAVLAPKLALLPEWNYLERLGWIVQSPDGLTLSAQGQVLVSALKEAGFSVVFTPFYIKDHYANPYFNATLLVKW